MKKSKKGRKSGEIAAEQDKGEALAGSSDKNANEEVVYVSPIAQPMASSKVTKKIRKLIKAGKLMSRHGNVCIKFCGKDDQLILTGRRVRFSWQ
jgi:hypothetical protein